MDQKRYTELIQLLNNWARQTGADDVLERLPLELPADFTLSEVNASRDQRGPKSIRVLIELSLRVRK